MHSFKLTTNLTRNSLKPRGYITLPKPVLTGKVAILIDGDNAQSDLLIYIMNKISKYGKLTVKRVYGDFSQPQL